MRLAFLGTGLMGLPMARRLLHAGHALTVWNRTRAKAEPLSAEGATVADDAGGATSGADIVFMILENGPVVADVLFDRAAARSARPGALFVDMSSIAPQAAKAHADRLAAGGMRYLDAPVSGGPDGARDGRLAIMVGGSADDYDCARPYLEVLGRPTLIGASGAGQFAKLASQMIVSNAITAVAEALVFARAQNLDPLKVIEALTGGYADSRVLQNHGRRMVDREFKPGGHIHTFVKDLRTAHAAAKDGGLSLPLSAIAYEKFGRLSKAGRAQCDISAIALLVEAANPNMRIGTGPDRLPEVSPEP